MRTIRRLFTALLVVCWIATPALATDFDFSGTFADDDDVLLINFSVSAPSSVTVFSSSWLQGNPPAGFDPILGIWTAGGTNVAFQDDGGVTGTTLSNGVPYSHGVWDSYFVVMLAAGDYIASVTQYNNFPVSLLLADGFVHEGNPDFTFDGGFGGATQPFFNGVWDTSDGRTGQWEFHLLNVESATIDAIPEPGTLALLGLGLVAIPLVRRRRHSAR
jgi:PEP-CTERM motif